MEREQSSKDRMTSAAPDAEPERPDDIGIAQAIARAVRAVPGVAGISPGRFALVATYGVHQRVPGVALRWAEDGALYVEAHVSLDASAVMPPSSAPSTPATRNSGKSAHGAPTLLLLADQIRDAIRDAIHALDLPPPAQIDIVMDDMT
jgi:hypothetical protein